MFRRRKIKRTPSKRRTYNGIVFKSPLEKDQFVRLRKLKVPVKYESDKVEYTVIQNYIPDFVFTWPSGRKIYIELKGWFRPEDRSKMISVKKCNPDLDIRLVFPVNNKINKNSTTRYSDWCEKNGFIYHIGDIPKEWFNDE